jgi:hypothetical protein
MRRCKSWRYGISYRDLMRDMVSLAEMRYLLKEMHLQHHPTLKKKEVCRTPRKGSVDLQKHPNVSKVSKKG